MATHSSIPAWRILWTEEPGGLQSTRSQKVRHDWVTNTHAHNIVVTSLFSDDFWKSPYHIAVRKVTTDIFHHNLYLSGFKVNPLKSNLCYCSRHHWSDVCSMECRRQSSFLICLECYTPGCALWRIQTAPSFTFILEAYGRCLKMTVAAIRGYRMM